MHARFFGLGQCHLHDLFGNALDFDVHLQSGNTVRGTGHFEVHIAQVIFVAQNIGQHRKTVVFLDQAHGDTGYVRFHGNARVHQRQATAADRSHGRGAVGLGDFRHHAHGVRKLFFARQTSGQSALGQTAVADFAALGRTHATGFAGGKGRHVVVQHEAVFKVAAQGVNTLGIALGAQGGNHQRLGFAAREQGRTVGAGQHAVADFDSAHRTGVAAVDTGLARQNLAANDFGFDLKQQAFDRYAVKRSAFGFERSHHVGISQAAGLGAGLLVANLVGSDQFVFGQAVNFGDQRFVFGRRFPVPHGLARIAHQFVDGVDRNIALLMAEHHGAQHDVFGQLLCFGLDHQHSRFRTRHHQVQHRVFTGGLAGVEHVLAVNIAHTGRADGAAKRNATDRQSSAHGDHGGDVCVHFGVERHGMHHDVHFIEEAFGEQGADGAVDQAAGQRLELAGAAFALEEAAGDLACGIAFLEVIHRQGEEILASFAFGAGHNGGQNDGAVHIEQHSAGRLACDFAGLHGDRMLAPLEGFTNFFEHGHGLTPLLSQQVGGAGHLAKARMQSHSPRCHSRAPWGQIALE